jgi:predicted permease
MPGLRKVPQVMFKTTDESTSSLLFFCLFSGSILSLSFSFFSFVSVFFDVTEGEKQGSGVDSICGVDSV